MTNPQTTPDAEFICRMDDECYEEDSFTVLFSQSHTHYWAALDFASHCYSERDGWEYMHKRPLIVWITDCQTGDEVKFSIETEFNPDFSVSEIAA